RNIATCSLRSVKTSRSSSSGAGRSRTRLPRSQRPPSTRSGASSSSPPISSRGSSTTACDVPYRLLARAVWEPRLEHEGISDLDHVRLPLKADLASLPQYVRSVPAADQVG